MRARCLDQLKIPQVTVVYMCEQKHFYVTRFWMLALKIYVERGLQAVPIVMFFPGLVFNTRVSYFSSKRIKFAVCVSLSNSCHVPLEIESRIASKPQIFQPL